MMDYEAVIRVYFNMADQKDASMWAEVVANDIAEQYGVVVRISTVNMIGPTEEV